MPNTIEAWLDYIQSLHVREIDLTLERVNTVYERLRPKEVDFKVITVAGTNGKGSTCELLTSIYHAAGLQTGKYTSPHVISFNERFEINRSSVSDQDLLEVLSRVEAARGAVGLTYFEFGTLAAIELFADQGVDVAIMEVGLGGRLDAVNILDADIALITNISVDHVDWLGDDIEQIALEKVAVTRSGRSCVVGMQEPPQSMMAYCQDNGVLVSQLGVDFNFSIDGDFWFWRSDSHTIDTLRLPFQQSGVQLQNAASAIMAVQLMSSSLPIVDENIRQGIATAALLARRQIVSNEPTVIVDVAHNQASIAELHDFVGDLNTKGKVYAICGMLKDKQIELSLAPLLEIIDEWNLVSIESSRGADAEVIQKILEKTSNNLLSNCFDDVRSAYNQVFKKLNKDDVLIVFGSFFIVGDIMPLLKIGSIQSE